jgi:hypothetical protein
VAPLIRDRAVVFFDDWDACGLAARGWVNVAFEEFLAGNPDLRAEELPPYSNDSKVFFVTRGEAVASDKRATRAAQPART